MQTPAVDDGIRLAQLELQIQKLLSRRYKMEAQRAILDKALLALDARLKGLYSKRVVELNFKLDL